MNKELMESLEIINREINEYDKCGIYYHDFNVDVEDNYIYYNIIDDENDPIHEFGVDIDTLEEDYSCTNILWQFIQLLYEEEINYRKKFIDGTKSFNSRKIKSMALWYERNNLEKVDIITKELIERSQIKETLSRELGRYKDIVRSLYRTKNIFDEVSVD